MATDVAGKLHGFHLTHLIAHPSNNEYRQFSGPSMTVT